VFNPDNGDRNNVPNIAIVITDGNSNENKNRTASEAQLLRQVADEVFVVGVTNDIDQSELLVGSFDLVVSRRVSRETNRLSQLIISCHLAVGSFSELHSVA